ncbi:MAG: DNA mismatch repair endonuclease MutL [Clostridiales bacterium]|jgi:DNA mismatch repair protein MutL|nr:DNA mismatch repair endonuclease MutL [Clostridiales bacterium]
MIIRELEQSLINKIAAGEVVERPASIVKELVENSIDAGASSIAVEIKDGGVSYISVSDNGRGIERAYVMTAFSRHATSKISSEEDLENILSLGFRGEALSSIAAVSQVELITRAENEEIGCAIHVNGGRCEAQREAGVSQGTTVIARNIFFNTPARRKFLKKPSAESGYITEMMQRFAIGRPEIAFKYINNGAEMIVTNGGGDVRTAALKIFGKETAKNIVDVTASAIKGFIGKPVLHRGNRGYEFFFLNGRYVKSEVARSAVENAYKSLLPQGKFPFFALNMTLSPELVDVNVHPAKTEVRFLRENDIYDDMFKAVSSALKRCDLIPDETMGLRRNAFYACAAPNPQRDQSTFEDKRIASVEPSAYGGSIDALSGPEPERDDAGASTSYGIAVSEPSFSASAREDIARTPSDTYRNEEIKSFAIFKRYKIIGQIFSSYWIVEQDDFMLVIDQHAAHERVLFEEISEKSRSGEIASQPLVSPIIIKFSEREENVIVENEGAIRKFGFDFEAFGGGVYALRAVPYIIKQMPGESFFIEIIDRISRVESSVSSIDEAKENEIAMMACKAAVKANDRLSYAEAKELIDAVMRLENPATCPHGRPTVIKMSKYEFERKFKRK